MRKNERSVTCKYAKSCFSCPLSDCKCQTEDAVVTNKLEYDAEMATSDKLGRELKYPPKRKRKSAQTERSGEVET